MAENEVMGIRIRTVLAGACWLLAGCDSHGEPFFLLEEEGPTILLEGPNGSEEMAFRLCFDDWTEEDYGARPSAAYVTSLEWTVGPTDGAEGILEMRYTGWFGENLDDQVDLALGSQTGMFRPENDGEMESSICDLPTFFNLDATLDPDASVEVQWKVSIVVDPRLEGREQLIFE